jgi:hypothetical protein
MSARARLTPEQFTERFVAQMLTHATVFQDGTSVEDYARETAPSYFSGQYAEDPDFSPEECADSDVSYWED